MTALLPVLLLVTTAAPVQAPMPAPAAAPDAAPAPPPDDSVPRPLRLGFSSSSAFGVTHAKFFNELLGARLDYRFSSRFAFGVSLSYANLEGKERRVHNALPEVVSEYRVPLQREAFGLPLRLALGYLPQNGPTLRLSAGLDFAISDGVSCELSPLEPMLWLNRDRPEVSLDGSLALRVAF